IEAMSCRDRGWMKGWVGALCLSSSQQDSLGCRDADGSHSDEDRHKAPSSTLPLPLSLQNAEHFLTPVRLSRIIDVGKDARDRVGVTGITHCCYNHNKFSHNVLPFFC